MTSLKEFEDKLEGLMASDLSSFLLNEIAQSDSFLDVTNSIERARVLTIKRRISYTHDWIKSSMLMGDGNIVEFFWCKTCNMRCSIFEHTRCLSIISRVKDKRPTYTLHNKYLMYTCSEIMNLITPGRADSNYCWKCGTPERAKTKECMMITKE